MSPDWSVSKFLNRASSSCAHVPRAAAAQALRCGRARLVGRGQQLRQRDVVVRLLVAVTVGDEAGEDVQGLIDSGTLVKKLRS